MRHPRRSIALLSLLLAMGLGLEIEHAEAHALGAELEDALRFVAGHDGPISEQHVESAAHLGDESCLACALRPPSQGLELREVSRTRLSHLAGAATRETVHRPLQAAFGLRFGRAPPTA